jgi:riboflavin-specific deaminase-like protein
VYRDLELPGPKRKHRPGSTGATLLPYVAINMVSSLDGKVSVSGKSGSLGSDKDRTVMRELRSRFDAVVVGAGTLRSETVSLTSEGRRTPEPYAVIPSASLDLDLENNLRNSEKDRTLVLTTRETLATAREAPEAREKLSELEKRATVLEVEPVETIENPGLGSGIDLTAALELLLTRYAIDRVLVEGGPALNHALVKAGLVDEVFLTLAPKLLGGEPRESLNLLSGPTLKPTLGAALISAYPDRDTSEVFLRYRLL